MAGNGTIRITKTDRSEYARLVRNAKAKINRTKKAHGVDLSSEVQLPSLNSFGTRSAFNQWKKQISSFTNRYNLNYQFKTNKYGVTTSVADINAIQRNAKIAQEKADILIKQAKKKPFIVGGKKEGTVNQQMMQMGHPNLAGITRPPNFNFNSVQTQKELNVKRRNFITRTHRHYYSERNETMKNNFIEILGLTFNSDANDVIEKIRGIPANDFFEMYIMFNELDFDLYDSEGQDVNYNALAQINVYLDQYYNGELDMDLRDF